MNGLSVQVVIDNHHAQCITALQKIALLADTGSEIHRATFGADSATGWTANGWRVAEKMREIANDVIGNEPLHDSAEGVG